MRVAIITSKFNPSIGTALTQGAERFLKKEKVPYDLFSVPGAFELPYFAQKLIDTKKYDGLIALGCVIEGETDHYKAVCEGVTYGIQKISIENRVPVMFGVLMCSSMSLAVARSGAGEDNKGYECAMGLAELLRSQAGA